MWRCPECNRENDHQYDLCAKCGTSRSGHRDLFLDTSHRWRKRCLRVLFILAISYFPSYFLLGRHQSGMSFDWSRGTGRQFTYHDRSFPFDPWIYQPIAALEYWVRGKRSQVVIEYGGVRGGQPIYGFGPFE